MWSSLAFLSKRGENFVIRGTGLLAMQIDRYSLLAILVRDCLAVYPALFFARTIVGSIVHYDIF